MPESPLPDAAVPAHERAGTRTTTRARRRTRGRGLAGALVLALGLGAIGMGAFALARPSGAATAAAHIGVILEPTSLDVRRTPGVASGQLLIDNVYQGLVGVRSGSVSEIVPVLATALPEVSADGREYTFTLHRGVRFHSGDTLTADDVVASLRETLTTEQVGFTPREIARLGKRTVKITLAEPNRELMRALAGAPGVIVRAEETGPQDPGSSTEDVTSTANGTGPYRLGEWQRGDHLTLTKNASYWGEPATLDTAEFRFLTQGRDAVQALKSGEVDVHTALLPSLREEFAGNPEFTLARAAGPDVFTLAFNSAKAPLSDPRVRTALSRAINTDAIIASQNGDGAPLGGPISAGEPGYADLTAINAYDPSSAKQLLSEAGQENLNLTLAVPAHYDAAPLDLLKSQFSAVGVALTVQQLDFPTWLEQVYTNHDYQLSYVDHAEVDTLASYAKPDSYLGYDSAFVQDRFAASAATTDAAEAARLRAEAAERVAQDAPAKWLYNYTPTNVIARQVSGFPAANTNARINLAGVTVAAH
ncbi:ABC transporter substrate-binding protein [Leucobacter chromiireducens]|uniref:ABC transporter substrate-binding protein n=1 Tax=Leucobacter chromiireducens TaxID=283877 RepID=UPI00192545EF